MMGPGRGASAGKGEAAALAADRSCLAEANIDPASGLSTDYLNHFNEAVMLLEMVPAMPACRQDLAAWRPLSYHDHFRRSRLKHRELMMAAYDRADPAIRVPFDAVCERMTALVLAAAAAVTLDLPAQGLAQIIAEAAAGLKLLIARASALIHGRAGIVPAEGAAFGSQAAVDAIFA
jgi:hypothetical protein